MDRWESLGRVCGLLCVYRIGGRLVSCAVAIYVFCSVPKFHFVQVLCNDLYSAYMFGLVTNLQLPKKKSNNANLPTACRNYGDDKREEPESSKSCRSSQLGNPKYEGSSSHSLS